MLIVNLDVGSEARKVGIVSNNEPLTMAFPVPGDAIEPQLDLNHHLIKHPAATFFMRAEGDEPAKGEVHPGDLLIVDRSLTPKDGSLIVAVINGELAITRVQQVNGQLTPQPGILENPQEMSFEVWGVVTTLIRSIQP